ncbi:CPBP family intramembrane glutamic endopeptidase [Streptomyces sp. P6-2-1]|uniref:CPBP family intramembrane glutamic endopeptidase n=1 Tax=Streptomyces sp. P6-2-1 TaxID=3422591 RepID=UPI003D361FCC
MFSCVIANLSFLGDYEVHGYGSLSGALALLGFMAGAAVTEELMYRGLLFRLVERGLGTYLALALSGVVFAAAHLLNENATLLGACAIAVEAGGMLAAAYAATRSLWLPIGVHFGWNFAEAGIFGTEVSGSGDAHGCSTPRPRAPN